MKPLPKGGNRKRMISEEHEEILISWMEEDSQITLKQMRERAIREIHLQVSTSTISRCIHLKGFCVKKAHYEPSNMNNQDKKIKKTVVCAESADVYGER